MIITSTAPGKEPSQITSLIDKDDISLDQR